MQQLITEVRESLPFELPEAQMCEGPCDGCSMKLLAFLDGELDEWEYRLDQGDTPTFADLSRIMKTSKKIHKVMVKNGLIAS